MYFLFRYNPRFHALTAWSNLSWKYCNHWFHKYTIDNYLLSLLPWSQNLSFLTQHMPGNYLLFLWHQLVNAYKPSTSLISEPLVLNLKNQFSAIISNILHHQYEYFSCFNATTNQAMKDNLSTIISNLTSLKTVINYKRQLPV